MAKNPDYQQGKIYLIASTRTNDVYIGSTTLKLTQRFGTHKHGYLANIYNSAREVFKHGVEFATIALLEDYPCNSKDELLEREGWWQDIYGEQCINKNRAGNRSKANIAAKKYYQDHKEEIAEKYKSKQKLKVF